MCYVQVKMYSKTHACEVLAIFKECRHCAEQNGQSFGRLVVVAVQFIAWKFFV